MTKPLFLNFPFWGVFDSLPHRQKLKILSPIKFNDHSNGDFDKIWLKSVEQIFAEKSGNRRQI